MKPVIQEEITGCGIAAVAAVAGVTYAQARRAANSLGIYAADPTLWSETRHVRRLLKHYKIPAGAKQVPFRSWKSLPDLALLSSKWHLEHGRPFWHWVVFHRQGGQSCVLDSKKSLRRHTRTDLGRIKPKWFIRIG